jgi:hypothetical protein
MMTVPGGSDSKKAVKGNFTVEVSLYNEMLDQMDTGLDQPMYQVNQAAQGAWYTAQNTAYWRTAITVLFLSLTVG